MSLDGCVCANCEAERRNFIGLRGPQQFIYTGSNTHMASPPQLPPVSRDFSILQHPFYNISRNKPNVPPVIGIEYTSNCIEKIDSEGYALYQSILENPHDLAPRLIYADWLREHGDEERADFIQWMIELRDFNVHDHGQLARRFNRESCHMLLDKNLATWHGLHKPTAGSLYGGVSDMSYSDVNLYWRNGFVDSVNFVGQYKNYFMHCLSRIMKVHPIRAVSFDLIVPAAMAYLINRTHRLGDNLFGSVRDNLPNELKSHLGIYFFENSTNFLYEPNVRKLPYEHINLLQIRGITDPCVLPAHLFKSVLKYGHKLVIYGCEFVLFDGQKNAVEALSKGAIDCGRSLAGLTPLKEHPKQVFNFKIDDPWFNPAMRERLPYYRYPTGISASLEDRPTLHNWVQSATQPIPQDWVRDQLGLPPFVQTDDKKEGE